MFMLTPLYGSLLVVLVVIAGYRFRDNWKHQPDGWKMRAWVYGLLAGIGLLILSFIPLAA
ncbi:MAG: hypothetical protein HWE23_08620 [Rhodobacteraceae bacterium]|nr:hypothetical protein [Paracoccaceae bacterium]